jgi:triosephosphate isomerase (TIM)
VKYLIANWKMYTTPQRAIALFTAIQEGLRERTNRSVRVPLAIICPPFVSLAALRHLANRRLVALGAQNCHWQREGPYTGEISPEMLCGLADYVLLGHRERRAAGETDEQIARKAAAAAACGIVPVLFVGEDHDGDDALAVSDRQLRHAVSQLDLTAQRVLVVYEPAWAIGGDEAADPDRVATVAEHLKARQHTLGAAEPEVLYGGTVNDDTIDAFTRLGVLDGLGATRAALEAEAFLELVDRVALRPATATPRCGTWPAILKDLAQISDSAGLSTPLK